MLTPPQPGAWWPRIALAVVSPLVFLLLAEAVVRLSGASTDLARNENFDIAVPVWLLADENWVDIQRGRLKRPQGVRAADVEWLQYFEEARYIQYKLKPNVSVAATNPFNEIELRKGVTFRLESNSAGFRTKEFEPKSADVTRIVTLGDSSTFGWGVDPEYTYQLLLQDRLTSAARQVEVLNLGVSGHTSRHGRAVFDHYARDLAPDALILSFGANDGRQVLEPTDALLAVDDTWLGDARELSMRFETFRLMRRLIFAAFDPFDASRARAEREGDLRRLVDSVPVDQYKGHLRHMIGEGRALGAETVLLSLCAPPEWARAMREVADAADVPLVDALELFRARLDDLRAHRIYAEEVRFAEAVYGRAEMDANWRLYVTSDGCHPGRAGHSLIADALPDAFARVGLDGLD